MRAKTSDVSSIQYEDEAIAYDSPRGRQLFTVRSPCSALISVLAAETRQTECST